MVKSAPTSGSTGTGSVLHLILWSVKTIILWCKTSWTWAMEEMRYGHRCTDLVQPSHFWPRAPRGPIPIFGHLISPFSSKFGPHNCWILYGKDSISSQFFKCRWLKLFSLEAKLNSDLSNSSVKTCNLHQVRGKIFWC